VLLLLINVINFLISPSGATSRTKLSGLPLALVPGDVFSKGVLGSMYGM
jgi:hypothetical protein